MKSINLRRLALCGAALCLAGIFFSLFARPHETEHLEVRILDVGQGDATLIFAPGGGTMLVDAGPNSAEEELCGMLLALGVRQLDAVIFTHPDEDHIGGGDLLLERFPVACVYLSPCDDDDATYLRLLEAATAEGCEVLIGEAGVRFSLGEADVTLLAPSAVYKDANNASIVTRIDYGSTAVLLMGDAEGEAEEALLAGAAELRADLLKIGHHGANTSTGEALLDAVQPTFAAISCGRDNSYGHPARRVIDALTERGIEIGRTDREGMLLYVSDGVKLWRE